MQDTVSIGRLCVLIVLFWLRWLRLVVYVAVRTCSGIAIPCMSILHLRWHGAMRWDTSRVSTARIVRVVSSYISRITFIAHPTTTFIAHWRGDIPILQLAATLALCPTLYSLPVPSVEPPIAIQSDPSSDEM